MNLALVLAENDDARFAESLSHHNMAPYFLRHGIAWDPERFARDWPLLENYLILRDKDRVGMLRFSSDAASLHIRDIQLRAEFIGRGIGTWAIGQSLVMARQRGHDSVVLRVFKDNPARHLYERCGFVVVAEEAGVFHMRCSAF